MCGGISGPYRGRLGTSAVGFRNTSVTPPQGRWRGQGRLKRKGERAVGLKRKGEFTRDRETDGVVLHKKSSLPYKLVTNIWRDPEVQASASYQDVHQIRTWGLRGKMHKPNQVGNIAFRTMGNDNQEGDSCDGGKKRNRKACGSG
ncbi:hypothetical protein EDB85DRAFT_1894297 [Lactarius pseudohatsudake]|nr:hypothetical protein EDB85DRAFT_1894297 [Lactarius pseudohatsudake]